MGPLVYLASRSPRRRELLRQIGVRHEVLVLRVQSPRQPDADETPQPGESPAAYAARVATDKARAGAQVVALRRLPLRPVLAADTVVSIDGEILGKPADREQAAAFLRRLAGRTHEVRTYVALALGPAAHAELIGAESVSAVRFAPLDERQIARYCASGEPFDKAGGYAIQGMAASFIAHLEGSYSGVMGLPLYETAQLLRQAGVVELP
jgi:septum formation protein